uniref:Uncharacterized protein n=1 Tax=Meloidogyne javanica TaxID=6303 RepID=A0A915N3U3_MELJA
MAITLMYAKIGINLMSDHSMKVFTSFAIDVSLPSSELKDELFLYAERPFRAQHLYYRGSAKKREVDNLIKNVKVLIEQFEKFDVNHIKAKLESYKEDGKLNDAFLKEFEYLILYDEEHEDTIFGRTFKFAHKADKNGLCDAETDYIDEY